MHRTVKNTNPGTEPTGELDFQKLIAAVLERKWIILGCLGGTLLLGLIYIMITPKTYSATTVVQVLQEESKFVKIEDVNSEDLEQAEVLKTIETNLTSSPLLLGVIDHLKLTTAELGLKPKPDGSQYTDYELVQALNDNVVVKLMRGTRLINVTASNTNPVLAQQISGEIVNEYVRINTAQRAGLSSEANKFLLEESDVLQRQVKMAEDDAQAFKDAHPGVAVEDSQDFVDQKLLALNGKLNDAKEHLFQVQSDSNQVQRLLASGTGDKTAQLLTISSVSSDPAVLQLQNNVANAQAALAQLAKRYRPKHPAYIQAEAQLAGLQAALGRAAVQAAQGLSTQVESAKQTELNFEAEQKVLEKAKVDNDKVAIPYKALSEEVDANRELYESVRMRLKETEVTRDIGSSEIQVAAPAMLPLTPSKPKTLLVLLACIIGGLLLGAAVSHVMSVVDTSFRSVDAAESALGLPVLAAVQELGGSVLTKNFLISKQPEGIMAESFRTLRTTLSIEIGETERGVILFTSAVPGEGKSFCAVNYAIALAQLGKPVLLIDADLRLPTVSKTLLGATPKLGVNTVITRESTMEEAVRPAPDVPNLFVLPAGGRIANPAELLVGSRASEVIEEAASKFNWVVIDTAPVHAVSDTMLLVKHAQAVCFVIHSGKTAARVVKRAVSLLENAGAKPAGVVMNHISQRSHSYYYNYYGDYGKEVYGASGKKA
jgi:capsular exopolysaccharide synthesis family protein